MGKYIKQTVISHEDWFKPINEIAGCRYLKWDKGRFSFSVSYDEDVVRRLGQSTFLQKRLWAPAAQAYKDMIRSIAADAREADSKIKKQMVEFESDLDWERFIKVSTAQKDAFVATVIATQRSTIAKMKGEIERVWAVKMRQNRMLAPYKMLVIVENGVRVNSASLLLADLRVPPAGAFVPWQLAVKDGMRCCLDFSRQGKGIDSFIEEIQRELGQLRAVVEPARAEMARPENAGQLLITLVGQDGVGTIQHANKMLRFLKSRLTVLQDLYRQSIEAVGAASIAAHKAEALDGPEELQTGVATSEADLVALVTAIHSIGSRIECCINFEAEARRAIEAIVNAQDRKAAEQALHRIDGAVAVGHTALEVRSSDWNHVRQLATRLIGHAVDAARIARLSPDFFAVEPEVKAVTG